jgi:hypothetical protein
VAKVGLEPQDLLPGLSSTSIRSPCPRHPRSRRRMRAMLNDWRRVLAVRRPAVHPGGGRAVDAIPPCTGSGRFRCIWHAWQASGRWGGPAALCAPQRKPYSPPKLCRRCWALPVDGKHMDPSKVKVLAEKTPQYDPRAQSVTGDAASVQRLAKRTVFIFGKVARGIARPR